MMRSLITPAGLLLLWMLQPLWASGFSSCAEYYAKNPAKSFHPTPGGTCTIDLSPEFSAVADSIVFQIRDAFDGSVANSDYEQRLFDIGNTLHIETKSSTLRKRLLFKKGDTVNRDLLIETERVLRSEVFLADALIEVIPSGEGKVNVVINTFDQWTTNIPIGGQFLGNEFLYWFGVLESNLLGTGQTIGFFFSHDLDRNSYWGEYENKAFIWRQVRLFSLLGKSSDGFNYQYSLKRPLLSKQQKWSWEVSGDGIERSHFYYMDADHPGEVEKLLDYSDTVGTATPAPRIDADGPNLLWLTHRVNDLNFTAGLTRSFGRTHKFLVRGAFRFSERYPGGSVSDRFGVGHAFDPEAYRFTEVPEPLRLDYRKDVLAGVELSYYQSDYKSVKNFRNLRWSEDLDVGFRLTTGVYQNLPFLGAKTNQLLLQHTAVYHDVWNAKHFVLTSLQDKYFMDGKGRFEDGSITHVLEYQWKPLYATATILNTEWAHYFAREPSAQLLLGEEAGLNGYPNRYFAGQARILMSLEQRYFPPPRIEIGTLLPAFAVFLNAGNTFPRYNDFEWDELHYSAGLGLRLGASRSTTKVVNHFNFSVPLDPKYRDILSWTFSIRAKAGL